ncbi:MAG: hypothetical protein K0B87_07700 [Candidatus Syntrophosphaera sp.]|nr:hypothetical protein [Candidatus Syntrophosphaera sp.]
MKNINETNKLANTNISLNPGDGNNTGIRHTEPHAQVPDVHILRNWKLHCPWVIKPVHYYP